jgi:hypothetical protein
MVWNEMDWYDVYIDWIYGPFISPVKEFWYWLQVTFWYKYHLIDTKLPHTWHDTDQLMIYGMFSLLEDYVEIELAGMYVWAYEKEAKRIRTDRGLAYIKKHKGEYAYDEILELYNWWKFERDSAYDEIYEIDDAKKAIEYEDRLTRKDTDMLIRLIKIRQYLWT